MQNTHDYLIIGAGPAGVQMAYYLQEKGFDYLVLERGVSPGTFFKKQPRHGTLISINKIYTGYDDPETQLRWDWNSLMSSDPTMRIPKYSKKYFPPATALVQYLKDFVEQFSLNIRYNSNVVNIRRKDGEFIVELEDGTLFHSKRLLIATGVFKPYMPKIPGLETTESYVDVSVDPNDFIDQHVLILGKGNSAFETADNLVATAQLIHLTSPNPITMAWRSHFPGHLRAVNNNILDTYQLKSQNALINAHVGHIEHRDGKYYVTFSYILANDEVETLCYDRVINCMGFEMDHSIFDVTCVPKLAIKDRFAAITSWYESQNIPDLYFIGCLMQMRDYKKKQSTFIHGFRYNIRFLANYLNDKYHGRSLPCNELPYDAKALTDKLIASVNQTSSLWQQTGYLCDAIVYDETVERFRYYEGLPTDFMLESDFAMDRHFFLVTLEFGQKRIEEFPNTFAIDRVHKDDYARADLSTVIHPIVRHYYEGKMISEHHVVEDFDSVWEEDVHRIPLQRYFTKALVKLQTKIPAELA